MPPVRVEGSNREPVLVGRVMVMGTVVVPDGPVMTEFEVVMAFDVVVVVVGLDDD